MFRIIVAGSREFNNYEILNSVLEGFIDKMNKDSITIISGRAAGADTLGEVFAENHEIKLETFPADWEKYGKEAGFIRNTEMANYATADGSYGILFAFWDGSSNGTKDMINKATLKGMEKHIIIYKVNDKGDQIIDFETDTLDIEYFKNIEGLEKENFMNPPEEAETVEVTSDEE